MFIHNPYTRVNRGTGRVADVSGDLIFLNVQNQVSAIAVGHLDPLSPSRDILVVAMGNSVLAYDVFNNTDLFYKEVRDHLLIT